MSKQNIFGINAVKGRLAFGKEGIETLLIRSGDLSQRLNDILLTAQTMGCGIQRFSDDKLSEMTEITHQGVGLTLHAPKVRHENYLYELIERHADKQDLLFLILDGVVDPRNLGACLRSAATLGVQAVIVPKDNSAALNEAAVKTASGGASFVPLVQVVNLARCMNQMQKAGVWTVGTLLETDKHIADVDLRGNIAIVMGSEGKGLRQKTIKSCDFLVKIPMHNENFGFNVSVATGICLYEVSRQRQK